MRWSLLVLVAAARVAAADPTPVYACKVPAADAKVSVQFKPEVPVADLAIWITGLTCKNFVFDSAIAKHALKVTIVAAKQYTPKQAVDLGLAAFEAAGLVVTQKADTYIVKLGPNMPRTCPDVAATTPSIPPTTPVPTAPQPSVDNDDVTAEVTAGIKKIDDTTYEIKKAAVDKVLENPMAIMKGARVVPAMKDGKPDGFKLYAIRPSSVYAALGLANGDTLHKINGFELTSADKALEVYTKLRDATHIEVELIRRGKPVTLKYTIK